MTEERIGLHKFTVLICRLCHSASKRGEDVLHLAPRLPVRCHGAHRAGHERNIIVVATSSISATCISLLTESSLHVLIPDKNGGPSVRPSGLGVVPTTISRDSTYIKPPPAL